MENANKHEIHESSADSAIKLKRDHDSMDDFEHLDHESSPVNQENQDMAAVAVATAASRANVSTTQLVDVPRATGTVGENLIDITKKLEYNLLDTSIPADERELQPVPATPPPSANFEKHVPLDQLTAQTRDPFEQTDKPTRFDPKAATTAFMETERLLPYGSQRPNDSDVIESIAFSGYSQLGDLTHDGFSESEPVVPLAPSARSSDPQSSRPEEDAERVLREAGLVLRGAVMDGRPEEAVPADVKLPEKSSDRGLDEAINPFAGNVDACVWPKPEHAQTVELMRESPRRGSKSSSANMPLDDDSWNVVEKPDRAEKFEAPSKPLPPLPKEASSAASFDPFEMSNDFLRSESSSKAKALQQSGTETGDSEFESEPEPSPAKPAAKSVQPPKVCPRSTGGRDPVEEIAPKQIFKDMGLDAWFNPERLNPKVASLIYWRDPKKSGIVFGGILVVLLSLAYFSLISVLAYLSLLTLTGTVAFRIYKTVLQAVQKTSDGHPFKDILEVDLTLPAEKVHQVSDIAVAHANAIVDELRRLFLVEDFVDSVKFGVVLWCLTYVGSWFNGMTIIIIGVVALFTLPKIYETNKTQIDQNLALVHAKINEITAKVKAAIPIGKKAEPTKDE